MNKINSLLIIATILILAGFSSCTESKQAAPQWKAKHVILIGIDAWGGYSMEKAQIPNIRSLMNSGAYTFKKRSVLPSSSAPNWASMYMGAGPELHGYCEWGSQVPDLPSRATNKNGIFPTIFSVLRESAPTAEIGNICEWDGIRYLVDTTTLNYDKHVFEVETEKDSTATARFAVNYIKEKKPAFLNIVYDALDHTGHAVGHDTPGYYTKLEEIDGYVGEIIEAVKAAGIWEETILIVTADHGGIDHGHGGRKMEEMETPFIISGPSVKQGFEIPESMMQFDVAPTIGYIFGLEFPQVWIGRPMTSVFQ